MSFATLALRIAACRAVKGATLAADRVQDSAIAPIEQLMSEERLPVVLIATDEASARPTGRDVIGAGKEVELVIELAIASAVRLENADHEVAIEVPHTDQGLEVVLDILTRQVTHAVLVGQGPWAELFRRFCLKISNVVTRRGAEAKSGVRFAARQIVWTCTAIADPPFEGALTDGSPWKDFVAALKADAELASIGEMIEAEIEGPNLEWWQRRQASLALTLAGVRASGLGPFIEDPEPDDAVLAEVYAPTDDFSVTEEAADEQFPPDPEE